MEEGFFIGFNEWAFDKRIKSDLGLLLIISSLCAEKGYCYASNGYLANLFNVDEVTISRKLKNLEKCNYITIDYERRGTEITNRYIRLTKMLTDHLQKCKSTVNKNVKENNISINNINNNIKENIKRKVKFVPPTIEEIQDYIKEKNLIVNAKQFYEYFTEGNWVDSKGNKVQNWKQKLLTWNKFKSNNNQDKEFNVVNNDLFDLYDN